MSRRSDIKHDFVQFIPDTPAFGVLYVSIEFTTALHLCMCGCGREVVTPLTPTDWTLTFDGASVSLRPSIGNWSYPCESHYFITKNKVRWATKMTPSEVENGRNSDRQAKELEFGTDKGHSASHLPTEGEIGMSRGAQAGKSAKRLFGLLGRRPT
jgi:Family of unknown function (DUF6527)